MLGGMHVAVGARVANTKAYPNGKTVAYQGISKDSPMVDLVYALGVILSDRSTDATLALGRELYASKPGEMARVTGAMSAASSITDELNL